MASVPVIREPSQVGANTPACNFSLILIYYQKQVSPDNSISLSRDYKTTGKRLVFLSDSSRSEIVYTDAKTEKPSELTSTGYVSCPQGATRAVSRQG